jgi:hypothetical protein
MTDAPSFAKLVPGFDFLQGLVKNAGAALPNIGQWVAPTLNPEELEKRIGELRTVQFWLEQNAKMLAATIQALEVQRMTLSTLKTMNVQMEDLRESLQIRMPGAIPAAEQAEGANNSAGDASGAAPTSGGAVDPLQWWGALTKQFTELAANAMKDSASEAAKGLAGNVVKHSFDAAAETSKKAPAGGSSGAARKAPRAPRKRAAAAR